MAAGSAHMNTDDLKTNPGDPDWMDSLLRGAAQKAAYVDDAGFTLRVQERLPQRVDARLRIWILSAFASLAGLVGLVVFDGAAFIWNAVFALVTAHTFGVAQLSVVAFAALFYWTLLTRIAAEK